MNRYVCVLLSGSSLAADSSLTLVRTSRTVFANSFIETGGSPAPSEVPAGDPYYPTGQCLTRASSAALDTVQIGTNRRIPQPNYRRPGLPWEPSEVSQVAWILMH